ncbi:DAK1 domain containing protein [Aphelenchoides avenae]|nr:DAK1 domain containing protein [Aphelenchus avenae]
MALERLKAANSQAKLDLIYVDDDVALESKLDITVGGRGLAGAVLVLHIAGVLAEMRHATFEQVVTASRRVVENLATFGVSLYPCALPGQSRMFELTADEMELGLGIHGEPGLERTRVTQARDAVSIMLQKLLSSRRLSVTSEQPLAVLVNNLGSVSQLEMNIIHGEVLRYLRKCWLTPRI